MTTEETLPSHGPFAQGVNQPVPRGADGLRIALAGGYFKKGVPLDPWGNRYVYFAPGRRGEGYEIISVGTDGQESDDDISSSDHLDSGRALAR